MAVLPNTREYLRKWVDTATDGNLFVDFIAPSVSEPFGSGKMNVGCTICCQVLTCDTPETPEKIYYALQKFVGLHRHAAFVPPTETSIDVETNKWGYVPISTKKINRATLKDEEGRRFRE
jgi:hypothetical protein